MMGYQSALLKPTVNFIFKGKNCFVFFFVLSQKH